MAFEEPSDGKLPESSTERDQDLVDYEDCPDTLPLNRRTFDPSTLAPAGRSDVLASKPTEKLSSLETLPIGGDATDEQILRFGDYELLQEIARGGMGVVYKARQVKLNRIVAIKMILAGRFAGDEDVRRFRSEAEAAAQLDHPGIVPIFEIGEHQGQYYFSMGYVEGESLAAKVARGPLPFQEAAELVRMVCEAISYAHKHGVIHRDLKPANILLDQDGRPKVTDFGLAKQIETDSSLTRTGQILGTPSYMPPEQASGKVTSDPTADVYSLGAVLYCLLAGRPPFQASNAMDTLLLVMDQQPISPRRLVPSIPVDLESICLKCLEKDSSQRYASAADLAKDLTCYLNGEPVEADGSSTLRRAWYAMLRETRHVEIMAVWGKVWLWHASQIFILFLLTNILIWMKVRIAWPYIGLWAIGFSSLAFPVWYYRFRDGTPLTPVERQVGQVWGMFVGAVVGTGVVNHLMDFQPLHLLPLAVLECGMAFGCMAAILGGSFYPMAAMCFGLSILMTLVPSIGPVAFGAAFALGLLIPGWRFSGASRT